MSNHAAINEKTLSLLRCPKDRSELRLADKELVSRINSAIAGQRIRDQSGKTVERSIDGGLIRARGDLLYPIVDAIPVMLFDEAIPLAQLNAT